MTTPATTTYVVFIPEVVISCYVAVLNQKALKKDSNPFPVQFSCLKVRGAQRLTLLAEAGL